MRKAGEHPPHLRDLRLPPLSIRHLHASTSSGRLGGFIALALSLGRVRILQNPRSVVNLDRVFTSSLTYTTGC